MTDLPYTAVCEYDRDDTLEVEVNGEEVYLLPSGGSLFLTPKKAKKLAKAIKAAAKQAQANAEEV